MCHYTWHQPHSAQLQHRWPELLPDDRVESCTRPCEREPLISIETLSLPWRHDCDKDKEVHIMLSQKNIMLSFVVITHFQDQMQMTALFTYSIYSLQAARFTVFNFWTTAGTSLSHLLLQASTTISHWKLCVFNLFWLLVALLDYNYIAQELGQQQTKQHITWFWITFLSSWLLSLFRYS